MRIGLVVTGGFDPSGRERITPSLLWLVERLARRHEVTVFVLHYFPEPRTYPLLGATVHDIGRAGGVPGLRRGRQRRRLAAAIDAHRRFDVLHAYQGMPAIVAAPLAAARAVPLVATLDSGELTAIDDIGYGLQRRWIDRRAVAAAAGAAARLTVGSHFMAAMAARVLDRAPLVVPLGVDTAAFPPAPRADGPPWRLLRVGSLNRVKDYPTLLRAVAIVVARGIDVHLDVVGEDTLDGEVQRLAGALGLDPRVTFHGVQTTERVAALYARAHLHVVSSRHEGASIVMAEAAAAGVPSVTTAVGYGADWHPDRALAVPVCNPDALSAAIVDLLQDPERRARIASAARAWAIAHDADWTAARFEQIYAEVVAR